MARLRDRAMPHLRPRFTIRRIMLAVAVIALHCLAFRSVLGGPSPDSTSFLLILGALPVADGLALGFVPLVRWRLRGERPGPFVVGFELVGLMVLGGFVAAAAYAPYAILARLARILTPLFATLGLAPGGLLNRMVAIGLCSSFLGSALLIPAVVGGLVAHRCWRWPADAPCSNGLG